MDSDQGSMLACGTTGLPFLAKKFDHKSHVTRGIVMIEYLIVSNAWSLVLKSDGPCCGSNLTH
jgi:hypothetical protein